MWVMKRGLVAIRKNWAMPIHVNAMYTFQRWVDRYVIVDTIGRTHFSDSMATHITQRQVSPLTPTPESMHGGSPYFLKHENFDIGVHDDIPIYPSLESVHGVYIDGHSPIFADDHESPFHHPRSMYTNRCWRISWVARRYFGNCRILPRTMGYSLIFLAVVFFSYWAWHTRWIDGSNNVQNFEPVFEAASLIITCLELDLILRDVSE